MSHDPTPEDSQQPIIERVESPILVPTNEDFGIELTGEQFCDAFGLDNLESLHAKLQHVASEAYGHLQDFIDTPIAEQLTSDIAIADQLVTPADIQMLEQLAQLFEIADKSLAVRIDNFAKGIAEQRQLLAPFNNDEVAAYELKEVKTSLPALGVSLRSLAIASIDSSNGIPIDERVNSSLANATGLAAKALQGVVTQEVLEGTRETAAQFVSTFQSSFVALGKEVRMLCNPVLRIEGEVAPTMLSSTSQLLIAMDAVEAPGGKIGLRDYSLLQRAARFFEPTRAQFVDRYVSTRLTS